MQLSVTFRHMEATPALKDYAREKVERINKYFPDPIKAHVVLSCDRGFNHVADIVITLKSGFTIKGEETTEDMYSSIDLVMAKIERQVRRYKGKLQQKRTSHDATIRRMDVDLAAAAGDEPAASSARDEAAGREAEPRAQRPEPRFDVVRKDMKYADEPLTVEDAIMQMNLLHYDFLVFKRAGTSDVNIVYHRKDGSYGLIETGSSAGGPT